MTGSEPVPSPLAFGAMVESAREHRESGRLSEAVALLRAIVEVAPANQRARHQLGLALLAEAGLEDKRQGLTQLVEAVRLDPTNPDVHADLADGCRTLGDANTALLCYRRVMAWAPSRADLMVRFAELLFGPDASADAERWLRRALALRHRFGHGLVTLGLIQHLSGRSSEAIATLSRSIVTDPAYTQGFVALAAVLQESGAPRELVMGPARIAAERLSDRQEHVIPVVQALRDTGEEAEACRFATTLIDRQMEAAEADEIGRHGIRVLFPYDMVTRIGEFAHQLDLHVKMKHLGWLPPFVSVLVAPPETVVNKCLLDYWRAHVTVVDDPVLIERIEPLRHRVPFNPVYVRLPDGRALSKNRAYHAAQEEWERQGRGPLLDLSRRHAERGRESLHRLGVPGDAWFACVHVRESGYLKEDAASSEKARNADIRAFLPAIEAITRRGGWVLRLGDSSMTPLPAMRNVVDYALSAERSDWMDVFLSASGRLLLATTSGMMAVASNFGVPVAATNFFPPGERMSCASDLFMPKLIRERAGRRVLTFDECLAMPLALTYDAGRLEALGLETVDNEPEDILSLAEEMLERIDGAVSCTADDERLQGRWDELSRPFATREGGARVGRGFLRRHRHLFRPW